MNLKLNTVNRQQWMKFFTHLLVICMLFFLPELMWNFFRPGLGGHFAKMMYMKSAVFVAFFYINYYVIVPRALFGRRRSYLAFVLANLALIALYVLVVYNWTDLGEIRNHRHDIPYKVKLLRVWSLILKDVAMIVLTIALGAFLRFAENWNAMERHNQKLLNAQREEEIQNLRSQINPHFLFNTLNTIYSLIDIDAGEARHAVHQLSKLLRHVLYENPAWVSLGGEVDFAATYISLMEMRLGPGVVRADFSHHDPELKVPPLIFVTLIENAFKHGNTGVKGHPIEISIMSAPDGTVTCRTSNHFVDNVGDKAAADDTCARKGGIGMANLRRRLQLIYGDRASLSTSIEGDTYTAVLTLGSHNNS